MDVTHEAVLEKLKAPEECGAERSEILLWCREK